MGSSVRPSAAVKRVGIGLGVLAACAAGAPAAQAALPDGRAYELVSSGDDNLGQVVRMVTATDSGDRAMFIRVAGTDDAHSSLTVSTYTSRRTASGWAPQGADPVAPPVLVADTQEIGPRQASADLARVSVQASFGVPLDPTDLRCHDLYRVEGSTGAASWLSRRWAGYSAAGCPTFGQHGASTDLSHIAFSTWPGSDGGPLIDGAPAAHLYEWANGTLRSASVLPDGTLAEVSLSDMPEASDRGGIGASGKTFAAPYGGTHVVSADGRRIWFNTRQAGVAGVYLRQDGSQTIPVSASQRAGSVGDMAPATFIGAARDGSVGYFASTEQLTDDATVGGGIYRFTVAGRQLEQVTPDAGGTFPNLIEQAILSDDASHLYFASSRALAPGGTDGVRNIYVHTGGVTRFIASVPGGAQTIARVSRNGRYAALRTTASLGGAANAGHEAVYLYDAQDGGLACASCRPDGSPSQGDATLDDEASALVVASLAVARNITDDGQLFFATSDQLVAGDAGPVQDVYRYREADGDVALISSGQSTQDNRLGDNSDDGSVVFFLTKDSLTGHDTDLGLYDIYAARVGGGFPEPTGIAPGVPLCHDDACQDAWPGGVVTAPPATTKPSGGNVQPGPPVPVTPRSPSEGDREPATIGRVALGRVARARLARSGRAPLRVRVAGSGRVKALARAKVRGKRRTVAKAERRARGDDASTVRLPLKLSRAARRTLARRGSLQLVIQVRLRGTDERERLTVNLTSERS